MFIWSITQAYLCFGYCHLGDAGRNSDRGVFANSQFGQALYEGTLVIPDDKPLPGNIFYNPIKRF